MRRALPYVIENHWKSVGVGVQVSNILHHDRHPEGLEFSRVRFSASAPYQMPRDCGALLSVLAGEASLSMPGDLKLKLGAGMHLYLPPGSCARFVGGAGTHLLHACAPSADRARGKSLILRDDQFLAGCAVPERSLRWILTPQYLSRRVFLHHDETLVSPSGEPLSWFHTTMFDSVGLPVNQEGEPVFKMSYNYRTEPNVCYEVIGAARVRMALHPYSEKGQIWSDWNGLTRESTYHLSELSAMEEWVATPEGPRPRRNKHEVQISGGHVSLVCMHHPACTGAERHSCGEYSEYGDLGKVIGTPEHRRHLEEIAPLDAMLDALSMAKARGSSPEKSEMWARFVDGAAAQHAIETRLLEQLAEDEQGREQILRPWVLTEFSSG